MNEPHPILRTGSKLVPALQQSVCRSIAKILTTDRESVIPFFEEKLHDILRTRLLSGVTAPPFANAANGGGSATDTQLVEFFAGNVHYARN